MNKVEIGRIAEGVAYQFEKLRLRRAHSLVKLVSDNSRLGFDIQSVESEGDLRPRFIEVKTANESCEIFLTERERINLAALGKRAWIYLVDIRSHQIHRMIQDPMSKLSECPTALIYKLKI